MPPKQTENLIRGEVLHDTLTETTTDEAGRFRFDDVTAPAFPHVPEAGQSVYPWDIVALAKGHGLAWVQLTPQHQRAPITLKLGPEKTIRGRVVEPGGKPVVGAKVRVHGIDPLGRPLGNGLQTENRLNLIWSAFPLGATTDADGRFTVAGIPRGTRGDADRHRTAARATGRVCRDDRPAPAGECLDLLPIRSTTRGARAGLLPASSR